MVVELELHHSMKGRMLVHRKEHKEFEEHRDPERDRVRAEGKAVGRVVDRVVGRAVERKVELVSPVAEYSRFPYKLEHRLVDKGPGKFLAEAQV